MRKQMEALAKRQKFGVLATSYEGRPHCSLMAYVTDSDCREIYMVTHSNSRKYKNLERNPNVSILIDTRDDVSGQNVQAMTIEGVCCAITDPEKARRVAEKLQANHPQIQDFLADPGAELLCVRIESFLLLDGLTDAYFERID